MGLSTNVGIAKTVQSGYATIINKKNYPDVKIVQEEQDSSRMSNYMLIPQVHLMLKKMYL